MYADTRILYPYYQDFSLDLQAFDDLWGSQKATDSMASAMLEYDLGAEGDLFKAPEPIIEQQMVGLDPMTNATSIIPGGEDVISRQAIQISDIESIQNEQLLSEVFCEFKKDLLANEATGNSLSNVLQIQIPHAIDETPVFAEEKLLQQGSLLKSISLECISSTDWVHGNQVKPNFMDFPGIDFGATYGMRRSISEGDIKTLGNGGATVTESPLAHPQIVGNGITETRREKLSRYRTKRTKRNFGRKIKYACRKALADSQPRIRGRFAKTEECDSSKILFQTTSKDVDQPDGAMNKYQ